MTVLLLAAAATPSGAPVARTPIVAPPGSAVDVVARTMPGQLQALSVGVRDLDGVAVGVPVAPMSEVPAGDSGLADYIARVTAPEALGAYEIVWVDSEGNETAEPLVVSGWTPTPADVARFVSAYAREHVGGYQRPVGDRVQAGRERETFTADTDPTLAQVTGYIEMARDEVLGRVGKAELAERLWMLARVTATWHAAASVEAKRRPAQTDDASGSYRAFIANYRASLDELISQARTSLFLA